MAPRYGVANPRTALALWTAAMGGCGSDSDDGAKGGADAKETGNDAAIRSIPAEEFVEKGNAVCRANGEAIGSKFASLSQPPTPAELSDAFETMLRESYNITGSILAIGAPEDKEKELVDLLLEAQRVTEQVEAEGQAAFFARESDPWAEVTADLVAELGLTDCQSPA